MRFEHIYASFAFGLMFIAAAIIITVIVGVAIASKPKAVREKIIPIKPSPYTPDFYNLAYVNACRRRAGLSELTPSQALHAARISDAIDGGMGMTDFLIGYETGIPLSGSGVIGAMSYDAGVPTDNYVAAISSSSPPDASFSGPPDAPVSIDGGSSSPSIDTGSGGL